MTSWRQASLRWRLFLAIASAIVASLAAALGIAAVLVNRSVQREAIASLGRQAELVARQPAQPADDLGQIIQANGEVLARVSRQAAALLLPDATRANVAAGRPAQGTVRVRGRDLWFAARAAGRETVVLLRPARVSWPLWPTVFTAGGAGVVLAGLLAFLMSRGIARPVRRVAEASRALATGERPDHVPPSGPAEFRALANSFNGMSDDLAQMRRAEQSFLLSVSHELKTPLTAIRGHAEALGDGMVEPDRAAIVIQRESRRLQRLVQDLLDLARLNVRAFTVRQDQVMTGQIADDVVERHAVRAAEYGVILTRRGASGTVVADHDRLLQVVSNLVENALRCTPKGGSVQVIAGPDGIEIDDTGPGFDDDDLPHAFDRFFLYDKYGRDRPVGTGLGLAIVKELAEAMDGSVTAGSSPSGGARFVVRLPTANVGATVAERPG